MKKNKMMRAASALMVATLLTTSVISGTFAKYVTSGTASDKARVAFWNIDMSANGQDMFKTRYDSDENYTVTADGDVYDTSDLVAPGTSGKSIYSINGKAETKFKVTFDAQCINDVYIGRGATYKYVDDQGFTYTIPAGSEEETVSDDYYPIIYTVKVTGGVTLSGDDTIKDTEKLYGFDKLKDALDALNNLTLVHPAGNVVNIEIELGWQWLFDNNSTKPQVTNNTVNFTPINDELDTVLGEIVSIDKGDRDELVFSGDSSQKISYVINMTATQID